MTRREFLKTLGRLLGGAILFYILQTLRSFGRPPSSSSPQGHTAKFYGPADDLAG